MNKQSDLTPNTDLINIRAEIERPKKSEMPAEYLITCSDMPIAKNGTADEIKRAYALTQAAAIRSCERHQSLVNWLHRNQ